MIGNIFITLALLASFFTVIMYYYTYKGYSNTLKFARIGYHTMTVFIIAASALLLHAILTHDYQFKYVFNYSGSDLSFGLLMSTFWAGQEGSFLLWLLFTAIIGLVLIEYTSKRGDLESRIMMIFTLTAGFLLLMISPALKNPFTYIWADPTFIEAKYINPSMLSMPFIGNFYFQDPASSQQFIKMGPELFSALQNSGIALGDFIVKGKGLNPLLQNFWMQIHPPILFVGFALSTVPFTFAFASLLKNEYTDWIKQSLPWVLGASVVLGVAIMLGGYWAYGVLGWGGYWGWDPVENSSLVPWIISVALIHTMLVQKKTQTEERTGRFVKTNLILAIFTYLLVLYSTFLTRSGILGDSSVHSFVDPGMMVYLFLLMFVLVFSFLGIGGLAYRWKFLTANFESEQNMLSKELALFTGAVTLIASAVIILFGTSAPIFGQTVEISFYNELNLPIAIIIGVLNSLSLYMKWKFTDGKEIFLRSKYSLIATLVLSLAIVVLGGITEIVIIIFTFATIYSLVVNSEIAVKIMKTKMLHTGAYISHIGIALFFLGVIATGGFTKEKQVDLPKGEKVSVLGYDLTFTGYAPFEKGKKYKFNIDVTQGDDTYTAAPVMFIAEFNNSLMREPDIINMITKDFYISPVGYDENQSGHTGQSITLEKGNSYDFEGRIISFDAFNFPADAMNSMRGGGEFRIGAVLSVMYDGKSYQVEPQMKSKGGERTFIPVEIEEADLKIEMTNLDASGHIVIITSHINEAAHSKAEMKDILSIEASIKPFINLVWLGVIITALGFIIAMFRRSEESTL